MRSNEVLASTSTRVPDIDNEDGLNSCSLPFLDTVMSAELAMGKL